MDDVYSSMHPDKFPTTKGCAYRIKKVSFLAGKCWKWTHSILKARLRQVKKLRNWNVKRLRLQLPYFATRRSSSYACNKNRGSQKELRGRITMNLNRMAQALRSGACNRCRKRITTEARKTIPTPTSPGMAESSPENPDRIPSPTQSQFQPLTWPAGVPPNFIKHAPPCDSTRFRSLRSSGVSRIAMAKGRTPSSCSSWKLSSCDGGIATLSLLGFPNLPFPILPSRFSFSPMLCLRSGCIAMPRPKGGGGATSRDAPRPVPLPNLELPDIVRVSGAWS